MQCDVCVYVYICIDAYMLNICDKYYMYGTFVSLEQCQMLRIGVNCVIFVHLKENIARYMSYHVK